MKFISCIVLGTVLLGVAPSLDSQVVLARYVRALDALDVPKNVIYTYTLSQAGPANIEQKHVVYRSGSAVRDELLGIGPKGKVTTITDRIDRYAIARVAPRPGVYGFLFVRTVVENGAVLYLYDVFPFSANVTNGFTVTQVAIDAKHFLPRRIAFHATNGVIVGKGVLQYVPIGAYWMPVSATVTVHFDGTPAQERITWIGYRFPASLPALTFTR